MDRLMPLGVAFLGVAIVIGNRKWALLVMHNHRLLRGATSPENEARLLRLYRIVAVLTGCFFMIFGLLGAVA